MIEIWIISLCYICERSGTDDKHGIDNSLLKEKMYQTKSLRIYQWLAPRPRSDCCSHRLSRGVVLLTRGSKATSLLFESMLQSNLVMHGPWDEIFSAHGLFIFIFIDHETPTQGCFKPWFMESHCLIKYRPRNPLINWTLITF